MQSISESYKESSCGVAVLVGGRGSRLGNLTLSAQKCSIDVNGQPFLQILIKSFYEIGYRDFVLLAGYRSQDIISLIHRVRHHLPDISVSVITENNPLGAGGAISNIPHIPGINNWILINGDTFYQNINFMKNISTSPDAYKADITLFTGSAKFLEGDAGTVSITSTGQCTWRRVDLSKTGKDMVFSGIALLSVEVLRYSKDCFESFEEFVLRLSKEGVNIAVEETDLVFYDIGTVFRLREFTQMQKEF